MIQFIKIILFVLSFLLIFSTSVFAVFNISNTPSNISENEAFSVTISLTISGSAGNSYYLRAAFSHPDTTTSYFGYTKNNTGSWYNGKPPPLDYTQFYQVTMNQDNSWTGTIEVKPDPENSSFKGTGDYNFKVGRYTRTGSGPTWSDNSLTITVTSLPTATPSPSPSPSPTLTPSSAKGMYKINEVKDKDGNVLSSVKIYVDGTYIHHYAPETLSFCDGCRCDLAVNCGFGFHTISLEKAGFENWSETKTISSGDSYEVNPTMSPLSSSPSPVFSATPTPTQKSILSKTSTFSPTPKILTTGISLILGEEATLSGAAVSEEASEEPEAIPEAKKNFLPKILFGGVVLAVLGMIISVFLLEKRRRM